MKKLYKKYAEIINYLIVGCLTTVVSLGVYYALVYTVLNPKIPIYLQIANIISWIIAVTFAYFTNHKFVFKSQKITLKEVVSFYLSRVSTLIVDMSMMFILVTLCSFNDKFIKIIVQFIMIILNYLFSKFFVFKKENTYEKE